MTCLHPRLRPMFQYRPRFDEHVIDLAFPPEHPFTAVPPEELRTLHIEAFLGRIWSRILQQVRNPVQEVRLEDGGRQVQVLGCVVFSFEPDGYPDAGFWRQDDDGVMRIEPMPRARVTIEATPHRFTWLEAMKSGFRWELEERLRHRGVPFTREKTDAYTGWAFERFKSAVRSHCDLRLMRDRIRRALRLDPFVVSVARRIRLSFQYPGFATLHEYAHVLNEREAYEKLVVEAPHLLALFAACATHGDFPMIGEPLERLSGFLRSQKRSPRLWRLLVKAPRNPIRLVFRLYRGEVGEAVCDYLRILDHLGVHELPPDWLVWNMLQIQMDPKVRRLSWWKPFREELGAYRHIARWVEEAAPKEREKMRARLYSVLSWLLDRKISTFDAARRKAGWKWLVSSVARAERDRAERFKREHIGWMVPLKGRYTHGPYAVHAIATAVELWEEGKAMHHCADTYSSHLFEGKRAVFSVREAATDKRVATIALERRAQWKLTSVAGFANRPVSEAVAEVARLVERRANLEEEAKRKSGDARPADVTGVDVASGRKQDAA